MQGNALAKSALETALLDAQGKQLGVPVHAFLGGAVRTSLPVLWTLASGDSARDIAEAEQLLAVRRHNVFKPKIGKRESSEDIAHVAAIKSALGERAQITVDLNQAWSEARAAIYIPELVANTRYPRSNWHSSTSTAHCPRIRAGSALLAPRPGQQTWLA